MVMSVHDGTLIDCSMENKLKTITFKFDISDVNPVEVANDLVCVKYTLNYDIDINIAYFTLDIKRFIIRESKFSIC